MQSSFPFMIFLSIATHISLLILILVVPEFLPHSKRQPFGGPGGGGGLEVMTVDLGRGIPGPKAPAANQQEPAPPRYIQKLAKVEEPPLESKTVLPDLEKKKKPKNEPTEKFTLNQPQRKLEGPFGTGKDTSKTAGKAGNQGQGHFGFGTVGEGGGPGGYGTGTGIAFPFPWYIEQVFSKIEMNWAKPYIAAATTQEYSCIVYFTITRAGAVTNVEIEQSSGIPALDRSAQSAVMGSAPFPPLPQQWTDPELAFRIRFSYTQGT